MLILVITTYAPVFNHLYICQCVAMCLHIYTVIADTLRAYVHMRVWYNFVLFSVCSWYGCNLIVVAIIIYTLFYQFT